MFDLHARCVGGGTRPVARPPRSRRPGKCTRSCQHTPFTRHARRSAYTQPTCVALCMFVGVPQMA
jgi:hypothetical protein